MGYLKTKIANKYFFDKKQMNSYIILKIIKGFMRSGKFERAYNILIKGTKKTIKQLYIEHNIKINIIDLLISIVNYLSPFCDLKVIRASGRRVLVPAPLRVQRKIMIAIRFLVQGFFTRAKKNGFSLIRAIKEELYLLYFRRTLSEAFLKKQDYTRSIFFNEKHLRFLKGL